MRARGVGAWCRAILPNVSCHVLRPFLLYSRAFQGPELLYYFDFIQHQEDSNTEGEQCRKNVNQASLHWLDYHEPESKSDCKDHRQGDEDDMKYFKRHFQFPMLS